jgi:hypothetical protein
MVSHFRTVIPKYPARKHNHLLNKIIREKKKNKYIQRVAVMTEFKT